MTIITANKARENVNAWEENVRAKKRERTDEVLQKLSLKIEELSADGVEQAIIHNTELVKCDPNYFLETLEKAGYTVEVNQVNYKIEW